MFQEINTVHIATAKSVNTDETAQQPELTAIEQFSAWTKSNFGLHASMEDPITTLPVLSPSLSAEDTASLIKLIQNEKRRLSSLDMGSLSGGVPKLKYGFHLLESLLEALQPETEATRTAKFIGNLVGGLGIPSTAHAPQHAAHRPRTYTPRHQR